MARQGNSSETNVQKVLDALGTRPMRMKELVKVTGCTSPQISVAIRSTYMEGRVVTQKAGVHINQYSLTPELIPLNKTLLWWFLYGCRSRERRDSI